VKWWLRFLAGASLLFPLAWLALGPWHRVLAPLVSAGVGALGIPFEVRTLDLLAPYDLAFFAAMVLATTRAPRSRRLRAAAIGVPVLVLAEIAFATLAAWSALRGAMGHPLAAPALSMIEAVAASFPWVAAPLAWVALLGGHARWPGGPAERAPRRGGENIGAARRRGRGANPPVARPRRGAH